MKALIVGSGAIGSAVARKLISLGYDVIVTFHSKRSLCNAEQLEAEGAEIVQLDSSSTNAVSLALDRIVTKGKFDVVVWSAGKVFPGRLADMGTREIEETFAVNALGPCVLLAKATRLINNGGKIVFFTSSTMLRESPGLAVYAASKAALSSLISSAAVELIQYGIRVYNLCPGRVASGLRRLIAPDEDQTKILQPNEVADVVAFLLSEEGTWLSTYPIRVHGGPYP